MVNSVVVLYKICFVNVLIRDDHQQRIIYTSDPIKNILKLFLSETNEYLKAKLAGICLG